MKLAYATISLLSAGLLMGAATPAAHAQQAATTTSTIASAPGRAVMTQTTKASAVIVAIDAKARVVTLKTASGKVFDVDAGPEVQNFDQLKVGQSVNVGYVEALSLELKKDGKGAPSAKEEAAAVRAAKGEKPAGAAGRTVTVLADVVAVNQKTQMVTLKGPRGMVDLHVLDPGQLKNIKKGDQIEAVYSEAVAVTVEPAKK
jgi:Cu/Ag efflux protein CusF